MPNNFPLFPPPAPYSAPLPPPRPPPPVRPLFDRCRDYAAVCGTSGAVAGACLATKQHASAFGGALYVGIYTAGLTAGFIGMRHALVQGQWEQDKEAVSGLAAGSLAMAVRTLEAGPRSGCLAGGFFFFTGCIGHHIHRYWLQLRLQKGWY